MRCGRMKNAGPTHQRLVHKSALETFIYPPWIENPGPFSHEKWEAFKTLEASAYFISREVEPVWSPKHKAVIVRKGRSDLVKRSFLWFASPAGDRHGSLPLQSRVNRRHWSGSLFIIYFSKCSDCCGVSVVPLCENFNDIWSLVKQNKTESHSLHCVSDGPFTVHAFIRTRSGNVTHKWYFDLLSHFAIQNILFQCEQNVNCNCHL